MKIAWFTRSRWFILQALWLLLSLGPFLHAHLSASHLNGFHDDAIQRVVHLQDHHDKVCSIGTDAGAESMAMVVGPSLSRTLDPPQPFHSPSPVASVDSGLRARLGDLAPFTTFTNPNCQVRLSIWAFHTPPAQAPPLAT